MGPFGSDQSRHVDDFGAINHNFDDFDAKKSSFGRLFNEGSRPPTERTTERPGPVGRG